MIECRPSRTFEYTRGETALTRRAKAEIRVSMTVSAWAVKDRFNPVVGNCELTKRPATKTPRHERHTKRDLCGPF